MQRTLTIATILAGLSLLVLGCDPSDPDLYRDIELDGKGGVYQAFG